MQKRALFKYSICTILLTSLLSCDPSDGKLIFVNTSNDTIFYSVAYCSDSVTTYPIIHYNWKGSDTSYSDYLLPKKEQHIVFLMDRWERMINSCKDSTLTVFFFSKDLIKNAGKDSIMRYQLYTEKKKLKVKELEKLNWRVTYP